MEGEDKNLHRGIRKLMGILKELVEQEDPPKLWSHYAECPDCDSVRFFDNSVQQDELSICPCPSCGQFSIIHSVQQEEEAAPMSSELASYFESMLLKKQKIRLNANVKGCIEYYYENDDSEHVKPLYKDAGKLPLSFFPGDEMIVLVAMIRKLIAEIFHDSSEDIPHQHTYAYDELSKVCDLIRRALNDYEEHNLEKLREQSND